MKVNNSGENSSTQDTLDEPLSVRCCKFRFIKVD